MPITEDLDRVYVVDVVDHFEAQSAQPFHSHLDDDKPEAPTFGYLHRLDKMLLSGQDVSTSVPVAGPLRAHDPLH